MGPGSINSVTERLYMSFTNAKKGIYSQVLTFCPILEQKVMVQ